MKITCYKTSSGFIPHDRDMDTIKSIPNGSVIELTYKQQRNYEFHKKVFAFLNYCFEHWVDENEYLDETVSFDVFRKNLLVLAGYKEAYYKIDGSVRVEAQSMAYDKMTQTEFEQCYHALIQAALSNLFVNDPNAYDKLYSFF